jgi:hypothetical protein
VWYSDIYDELGATVENDMWGLEGEEEDGLEGEEPVGLEGEEEDE